jgi:Amidases related to nicotinamidase
MKRFLVAVDLQKDFVDGALGSPEAVAMIPAAAKKIRGFDGEIFVTLDTHFENYMETAEGKKLPVPHCIKGTPGWELDRKIKKALEKKSYVAVEKNTFGSVRLPALIAEAAAGEEFSVVIIGLCTDICVVSNALLIKANFPEAEISVDPACCAGVTPEKHEAALETMRSCQIDIL